MIFGLIAHPHPLKRPLLTMMASAVIMLLSLAAYGYQPASSNIYNQMPAVMALLNPELFTQDFYVREMVQFTPRYYYYHLIALGVRLGLSLSVTCFLLYLAAFGSFFTGLYALGQRLGRSRITATALTFLGFAALSNGRIGFADLFRADPLPATLAIGIAIWGFYFCFCQRWALGYLFFGLACLLQFLVGALPGVLMALPLLVAQKSKPLLRLVGAFLVLGSLAGLVYVPMRLLGNTSSGAIDSETFVYLYGHIRHPHHLVFSTFGFLGSQGWLNFITFTLGGIFCIASIRSLDESVKTLLKAVVYVTGILLLLNFLFVEIYPVDTIAKLQFVRTTPFSQLIILVGISVLIKESYQRKNWPVVVLLLISPILKESGSLFLILGLSLWLESHSSQDKQAFSKVVCGWGLLSLTLIAFNFQGYWAGGLLILLALAGFNFYDSWRLQRIAKQSWFQYLCLVLVFWMLMVQFSAVGIVVGLNFVLWRAGQNSGEANIQWHSVAAILLFALATVLNYHYDLLLAIAIALPLLIEKEWPRFQQQWRMYKGLFAVVLMGAGLFSVSPTIDSVLGSRVSLGFNPDQDEAAIARLGRDFQTQSSPDALVLVPPQEETFRFYAQRSLVFTFKGFPFTDEGIRTWRERLETITGIDDVLTMENFNRDSLDQLYRDRSGADILAIAQRYGAGYIMTRRDWHPDLEGAIVAESEGWIIRLRD